MSYFYMNYWGGKLISTKLELAIYNASPLIIYFLHLQVVRANNKGSIFLKFAIHMHSVLAI